LEENTMNNNCQWFPALRRFTAILLPVCLLILCTKPAISQTNWTKYAGNPVMLRGQPGSWDDGEIYPGPVLFRDSVYHLWYIGWDGTDAWRYYRTGYARSTNGITWTKHPTPVVDVGIPGAWDSFDAEAGAVLYDGSGYKMWFNGYSTSSFNQQVGYATGMNETTWTKRANPVLSIGANGTWDDAAVMWTSVLPTSPPGGFRMWYAGWDGSKLGDGQLVNYQIGYATATNETTWTKHPLNPVLTLGRAGEWDDGRVHLPFVVRDSAAGLYYMFYNGMNIATEVQRIGLATSQDGIAWTKYSGNPVLEPGPSGTWDDKTLVIGGVIMVQDTFRMWYTGYNISGITRIGYATSPRIPLGVTGEQPELPDSYRLEQNYPNPFNPSTTIKYELPKSAEIRLSVYDMLGREVSVLVNETMKAGVHEVKFDASALSSGVYLYRLRAGEFVASRKLLLLK
jgi:predicted GH43/DUF377 family glycosyl hydrolase